jgi:hypothetical protein
MYTRYHTSAGLNDPIVVLGRSHIQDLERDIEQIHLAKLARATRPRHSTPLPALLHWLCAWLPRKSRGQSVGTPLAPFGELASAGVGQG